MSSYRDIPPSTPEEVGHHQRGNSSGDPNEGGRGDGYPGSALKSKFSVSPDTRSRSRSRKQIKLRPKDRGTGTSGTAGASAGAGAGAGVGGDTSVRPGSAAQPEKGFKSKTSFPKIGLGWSSGKKEKEKGKLKEKENERREGERDDGRTSSEQAKRNPLSDITNTTASRSGLINLM